MDTVTYPDPAIAEYISAHFVPLKLILGNRDHWPLFRANHVIWTPTAGFMDRNGSLHHHSPGYLPPAEFISVLKIGRARCLMAWTRSAEAAAELESAAALDNSLSPEALYWLGVARFLEKRGPGLHHIAYRVPDLPATLARLEQAGLQLIDREPRPGAHGKRIAFIHPRSTGGVLIELVEAPSQPTSPRRET